MNGLSLRARLTLWYVLVLVGVLAVFAVDVLVIQQRIGLLRIDRQLDATETQLTHMLREELRELDTPRLAAEESRNVIASAGGLVAILDDQGAVLAATLDERGLAELLPERPPAPGDAVRQLPSGAWRVRVRREIVDGLPMRLVVASPLAELARDQREVRQAILLGIPVALLLAAAGGLWVATSGLRPITTMAHRAASLPPTGVEDLGAPGRNDELGQLATAFNGLVARLRTALQVQRQFMADASHELRSPVSVIRAAADVALSREHREEAEYRDALRMTASQSRRLGALVDDMLVLARADAGGYPLRPVEFYLDDVIDDCRRVVSVLALDRGVTVTAAGASDVPVRGDQELLRRLVVNLLQNAVQHTPRDGAVALDVSTDDANARIRVKDGGCGIPEADRTRIFDRFVQLDPSRRSEGAGLGLTIAKWIAEVHGGALILESSGSSGTTFCVTLPKAV